MLEPTIVIAATALIGLGLVVTALLRAWHSWLALKQKELDISAQDRDPSTALGAARIEMSDLKERIRKLEAIASGVDL
ncbi:hypothetical protein GRI58_14360 [Porphyrobacter algicida]|uniref:Uncharacterized protein n=1 Tax=Qipengyuania algicida TaxID=1836209 RepID=A0A845AIA7_9SPHN|nr:hypothetical protein [Qipengyuania algicida]MXP29990.1 hypothetical protein [Qipengyuania algicida]